MKVIILAAGRGTRLRPYTDNKPKCMVELKGKALLHHQLEVLDQCGVDKEDVALVAGYLQEALIAPEIKQFVNKKYATTNMVTTLFEAKAFMQPGEDLIIAYSDIIYSPEVFKTLLDTKGDIVVTADLGWYDLWKLRMENPLDDAETFKMSEDKGIYELGRKPKSLEDVQAQYIGLIKVSGNKVSDFIKFYEGLDRDATYDSQDFDNMYMTSFLQNLIDTGWEAKAAIINRGWLEVDSVEDLQAYEKLENIL